MKLSTITFEVLLFGSLIAWQGYGYEGGKNLFLVLTWFILITTLLACCNAEFKAEQRTKKRSPLAVYYFGMRNLVVLVVAAWVGMFFLAGMWALSWAVLTGVRHGDTK